MFAVNNVFVNLVEYIERQTTFSVNLGVFYLGDWEMSAEFLNICIHAWGAMKPQAVSGKAQKRQKMYLIIDW